jgi:hemoglobin
MSPLARPVLLALSLLVPASALGADTLYDRLGGKPVLERVVDQAIGRIAGDPRVNQSFRKVDIARLDASIVSQLCALTGGGCRYDGDDMKRAHGGLEIRDAEFFALVDAMRDALDANGVGEREKNELLRLLAPMKRDVVTR